MDTLTDRQLNRATLTRQMLLERSPTGIPEAVAFLGGLQAQVSNDPYIALRNRLQDFRHEALTALIVERTLARATTMRGTLHLHTVDDLFGVRALVGAFLRSVWTGNHRKRFGGEDTAHVLRAGIALLDAKGPMTIGALGKTLQHKFPAAEPRALAMLVQLEEMLVQVPPTRLWGNGAAPLLMRAETWLPGRHTPALTRQDLVRRYLTAFGPASVADMQVWCRLTRLSTEFEALGDELVTFQAEDGRVLYDLPDMPRPDPGAAAPVRFLGDFDNVVLGFAERSRIVSAGHLARLVPTRSFRAVLVDGFVAAHWSVQRGKAEARLVITPFRKLTRPERREIEAEAEVFLAFLAENAPSRVVELRS